MNDVLDHLTYDVSRCFFSRFSKQKSRLFIGLIFVDLHNMLNGIAGYNEWIFPLDNPCFCELPMCVCFERNKYEYLIHANSHE